MTVADDGGSSGRLRETYRMLPPGDIRNCLLALSSGRSMLAPLFNFRFSGSQDVGGHSLGNLILTALSKLGNGFDEAVEQGGRLLTIQGQVVPSTVQHVTLRAEFADGSEVSGESRVALARRRIRRMLLEPSDARAVPQALSALDKPNSYIGKTVPRPNLDRLMQGRGLYVSDIELPRMMHAVFLRFAEGPFGGDSSHNLQGQQTPLR